MPQHRACAYSARGGVGISLDRTTRGMKQAVPCPIEEIDVPDGARANRNDGHGVKENTATDPRDVSRDVRVAVAAIHVHPPLQKDMTVEAHRAYDRGVDAACRTRQRRLLAPVVTDRRRSPLLPEANVRLLPPQQALPYRGFVSRRQGHPGIVGPPAEVRARRSVFNGEVRATTGKVRGG